MSSPILHITNSHPRPVVDGGTHREEALAAFLSKRGASRLVVRDESFSRSKLGKLTRLPRLMKEIRQAAPELIVLNYPSYPFFWQHKVTRYYWTALLFSRSLARYAGNSGAKVVIDVMDLVRFQHADLGLSMEMSDSQSRRFDKIVFSGAHALWVCSYTLAALVQREYGLQTESVKTVVNGSTVRNGRKSARDGRPFRFVYCGGLAKERQTEAMVAAFIQADLPHAELHLSGLDGEWIPAEFAQPNIIYHGSLSDADAAGLTSECDAGLIYYPQFGYYHMAFATKLAHYVCCGVPILCTDVRETGSAVRKMGVGVVADASDWPQAMRSMAAADPPTAYHGALLAAQQELTWEHLYTTALESGCHHE